MISDLPSSHTMVNETQLAAIRQDSVSGGLTSNDICNMFKEFQNEFDRMVRKDGSTFNAFLDAVEEIVDAILLIPPPKLLHPQVLKHPLIRLLHQILVDIIDQWHASNLRLNIQESDVFFKIILMFVHASEQAPTASAKADRERIQDLLATRKFLTLISDQVDDNVVNKEGINDDPNISTLGLLTIYLLQGCQFYNNKEKNERLIDDLVMNCLDSYDYIQAIRQLKNGQELTAINRFLLYTCWQYIPFQTMTTKDATNIRIPIDVAQNTYDALLNGLEFDLDKSSTIEPPALAYIFERCAQLLKIPKLRTFDKHANDIIDRLSKMIQQPTSTDTVVLEAFCNLSENTDIRAVMKKHQLIPLFNKYTPVEMGEKRQLAFSVLAQIMDEQDVKNDPSEMTAVFIDQLKQLNSKGYNPNVDITLSSLKALIQHEQIKDEFIKRGGLQSLISFIRDGDLIEQSEKQLEDALEILCSCTFNHPEVVNTLKQDHKLLIRVSQLLTKAKLKKNITLEKAAESFVWRAEKEEKFIEQQAAEAEQKKRKAKESGISVEEIEEEEEKYDLMISYSWADMDLAHRIFHHLTEKLSYKVWLDQEQMHGSTIEAMANAVENAQFILMCMSETYKRSANCQSEAEYAFNRKKNIVPCKMKKDYNADGWLGFILGTRLYIDFGTYEFEKAMKLLDNEMQLQKKKRKDAKQAAKAGKRVETSKKIEDSEKVETISRPVATNTESISSWSDVKVRDFLLKQNLSPMIPLGDGINGEELMNLYTMCKTSSASMYRSLKFELLHGHHKILPIATYLHFMSRMRLACIDNVPIHNEIKHSDDYSQDDE